MSLCANALVDILTHTGIDTTSVRQLSCSVNTNEWLVILMVYLTLETRRLRGDKIEVFKIVNDHEKSIGICSSNLKKAEPEETMHH